MPQVVQAPAHTWGGEGEGGKLSCPIALNRNSCHFPRDAPLPTPPFHPPPGAITATMSFTPSACQFLIALLPIPQQLSSAWLIQHQPPPPYCIALSYIHTYRHIAPRPRNPFNLLYICAHSSLSPHRTII